jgi:cis-3-alkyl-4-acyloxetan-2-one decarboxylase
MNTAAFRASCCPPGIRACRVPILGPLGVKGLNLFVRAALRSTVHKPERMTPAVRAGLAAPYDSWRHREAVLRFVLDIPMRPTHPSYPTLLAIENGLAQFRRHPVCLIWGMRDWCFTPAFLDRFLEFFPQAEAHRLAEAAHYLVEDAYEDIIPIVDGFLKTNR